MALTGRKEQAISPQRRILVPLDGSTFSEAALPAAVTLAEHLDADIELLSVTPDTAEWGVDAVIQAFNPSEDYGYWLDEYLRARRDDLVEVSGRAVSYRVRSGHAREVLLDVARERPPTVIVMTTHGRGPLTRAWLGSVADAVQREGPVPVLLVRPEDDATAIRPDLTDRPRFRHVLVPMDGSRHSEESLRQAVTIGNGGGAYVLLQVVTLPIARAAGPVATASNWVPGLLTAVRAEAEAYLDEQAAALRRRGTDVSTEVVADVPPAAGIVRYAEEHDTDLIVIGNRGRGGLSRMMLGSVADKVVRGAPCPVLVIPDADADN